MCKKFGTNGALGLGLSAALTPKEATDFPVTTVPGAVALGGHLSYTFKDFSFIHKLSGVTFPCSDDDDKPQAKLVVEDVWAPAGKNVAFGAQAKFGLCGEAGLEDLAFTVAAKNVTAKNLTVTLKATKNVTAFSASALKTCDNKTCGLLVDVDETGTFDVTTATSIAVNKSTYKVAASHSGKVKASFQTKVNDVAVTFAAASNLVEAPDVTTGFTVSFKG